MKRIAVALVLARSVGSSNRHFAISVVSQYSADVCRRPRPFAYSHLLALSYRAGSSLKGSGWIVSGISKHYGVK